MKPDSNFAQDLSVSYPQKTEKAFYKALLENLPAAVYTCDKEGKIIYYNEFAVEMWGYRPDIEKDDLRYCACYKVWTINGEYLAPEETYMAKAVKTGQSFRNLEAIVGRPDGSRFYASVNINPLLDENNQVIGAINIVQNISALKESEQALLASDKQYRELVASLEKKVEEKTRDLQLQHEELKKSEERYHKMIDEVEDYAIILLDKNGIVQNWNRGAQKIKGYSENEVVGKSFMMFYLPNDLERGLPQQLLEEAITRGKAVHEGWRKKKDGTIFWGSILLTALHDADRKIIGFSKVTRDLTEKKIAEDKLREYSDQLEFQNQELERFAYAASHDMKEPLRKIMMYNSVIADDPNNHLNPKSREYLNRSISAVMRMTKLIDDLLTYSKASARTEGYDAVDIHSLVKEILSERSEDIEQTGTEVKLENLPVVQGIPFQFKQLIDNLIANAIKYRHPHRSPVITLSGAKEHNLKLNGYSRGEARSYHRITVKDNGIGFEQEYAGKIFDIFQRLNNLPWTSGSGIGLAICKKIVQNHKGFIRAEGKPGEGAQFDIYLPVEM